MLTMREMIEGKGGKMMGLVDEFSSDGVVEVKYKRFLELAMYRAKVEMMKNAINCDVPGEYIMEMMTGKQEDKLDLRREDGYEKVLWTARSLMAGADEDSATVISNVLKKLIDSAEMERLEMLAIKNDCLLKEKEKGGQAIEDKED